MIVCCHIVDASVAASTPAGYAWGLRVTRRLYVIGTGPCLCALVVILYEKRSSFSLSDIYAWTAANFTSHLASQQDRLSSCGGITIKAWSRVRPLSAGCQHQAFTTVKGYPLQV